MDPKLGPPARADLRGCQPAAQRQVVAAHELGKATVLLPGLAGACAHLLAHPGTGDLLSRHGSARCALESAGLPTHLRGRAVAPLLSGYDDHNHGHFINF